MAYFQIPAQQRPYGTRIGGTRAHVAGNSPLERIIVETGKQVTLEISGVRGGSATPVIRQIPVANVIDALQVLLLPAVPSSSPDVLLVSTPTGAGSTRRFTINGIRAGSAALLVDGENPLFVISGSFRNHTGMDHDLIASAYRASEPAKTHVLTRMLYNNEDNLFNEKSAYNVGKWGQLACGTVSKVGGAAVFNDKLDYTYERYYIAPIPGKRRQDIKYDQAKLKKGLDAIKARLARGMPSLIGMVYDPPVAIRNGSIEPTKAGGHSVPIVGCSSDGRKFLYIDVWPSGSKLKYEGGHAGTSLFPGDCNYLGMFELVHDPLRNMDVLTSTTGDAFSGDKVLEVIAGPLTS